jgi:hypothetical protein
MKVLLAVLTATLVVAVLAGAETRNQDKGVTAAMLKSVVHVNFADSERQEHALGNIENIVKEVQAAQIEVVCHGQGINLVVQKETKHSAKLVALMKQGVRVVGCENTMKKNTIATDELVAGVTTVPSGAAEVIRKQQEGYAYFKP